MTDPSLAVVRNQSALDYEEAKVNPQVREEVKEGGMISNMPGYKILVVNDEEFLLFAFKLQLETEFDVATAENGLKALQVINDKPINYFDAILLDLNMPIMDGF